MNATFISENGKPTNYIMGCYGIGVSRTLAMIYENSIIKNDKNEFTGICLPINIVPYLLYIIPKIDDEEKTTISQEMYYTLIKENVNVLYDDRKELSIGAKIKDSKILGIPYVVVFGNTIEKGYVTIENNKTNEKIDIPLEQFVNNFIKLEELKNNYTLENIIKNQQ